MRLSVLGPLEVATDCGLVEISGTRLRGLLVRLAVDVGRPVAVDALVDALWPEAAPADPIASLHSLVWRLRQAFPDGSLVRSGNGWYQLELPRDAVDLSLFEQLADEGRRALRAGRTVEARRLLAEALALWRGEPLIDVVPAPYAVAVAVRLRERRLIALEDRLEADLSVESASSVAAELAELTAAHPLRERLCVLLMRALDADGRPGEALTVYENIRRRLAEELGTDPGSQLRQAHLAVLRADQRENARPSGNLRSPVTSFVGRTEELAQIRERMGEGRLLTLVGPGGVGKTRLATTIAAEAAGTVDGGVWLVELAALTTSDDVVPAVLAAVGPREIGMPDLSTRGRDPVHRLVEALAGAEILIVLDDCDHVVETVARVAAELLGRCPRLRILATSREPLGVAGELLFSVPPLALPEPGRPAAESPAVRLFADRAIAVRADFALTEEVAVATADVCRRLDGLPLAIELAAARLRATTLEQLAARLDDRLRVLTGGPRSAPQRHQTLRAVVAWSWDLLPDRERQQAARLAVFPSSFTAEAAEHIGASWETLDTLVDKSLLSMVGERYRMLATIRDYGLEQLAGATGAIRTAHATYFLDLAERVAPHLHGAGQLPWIRELTAERDNLLATLHFAVASRDAMATRRLGAVLGLVWAIDGGHAQAADWLHTALTVPPQARSTAGSQVAAQYLFHAVLAGSAPDVEVAVAEVQTSTGSEGDPSAAALTAGLLALATHDIPAGLAALDERVPEPDPWQRGIRAVTRSMLEGAGGDTTAMRQHLADATAAFRESGERWGLATALTYLALTDIMIDDLDAAAKALDEAITLIGELEGTDHFQRTWRAMTHVQQGRNDEAHTELRKILDDNPPRPVEAMARLFLADLARHNGDLAGATTQLAHAAVGLRSGTFNDALLRLGQGHLALAQGDLAGAGPALREAFTQACSMPDLPMVAQVAVAAADLVRQRGNAEQAAVALGAAHVLRGAPAASNPDVARLSQELRTALGPAAYQAAYDQGQQSSRTTALDTIANCLAPDLPRKDADIRLRAL
ncbi:ATP-binding protein [Amycolatopsis sp. NPDC051903]|uniref:ATP-binding protein n=1 Tax=Amycolatopsis sp. NPDC051903 TaxID=3363936 RepID=UPI003798C0C8